MHPQGAVPRSSQGTHVGNAPLGTNEVSRVCILEQVLFGMIDSGAASFKQSANFILWSLLHSFLEHSVIIMSM